MSGQAGQLATLLRMVQWEMDEAAHQLPSHRYSDHQCQALAAVLETVAGALRAYPRTGPGETHGNVQGDGSAPCVF